jgi:hypothetical protein
MECFYSDFHISPPITRWEDRHRVGENSSLTSQLAFISARIFIYSHTAHYFYPAPWTWETRFTPKIVVSRMSHWEVIRLSLCLLGQVWIWTWVLTSLMNGAPLPLMVPVPHWFCCGSKALTPNRWEDEPPPDQAPISTEYTASTLFKTWSLVYVLGSLHVPSAAPISIEYTKKSYSLTWA